jgi:hypothetical protein
MKRALGFAFKRRPRRARPKNRNSKNAKPTKPKKPKKAESADEDDVDDVPILELVRRGDYSDAKWLAPGRGKVLEIHKIVDWKIENREIHFLVWWEGYALRDSWEPAKGIHPVQQRHFLQTAGVLD